MRVRHFIVANMSKNLFTLQIYETAAFEPMPEAVSSVFDAGNIPIADIKDIQGGKKQERLSIRGKVNFVS